MTSRPDLIREYFRRQYESEETTTAENVEFLFAHDLVYHLGAELSVGREDLTELTDMLRRTRQNRITHLSDFTEESDHVSFVMTISGSDPDSGQAVSVNSRSTYKFRGDQVIDVLHDDPSGLIDAFRAAGVKVG